MTQQYFLTREELQHHFQPSLSLETLFEGIRKELLSEHKIMTRVFIDEGSFESEKVIGLPHVVQDINKIGYEFISVKDIVRDISSEWITVLEEIEQRTSQIKKTSSYLDLVWMKNETKHIEETFADLMESYESIREYFGDTLVAPFIQVDQVEAHMKTILSDLNTAIHEQSSDKWLSLHNTSFVKVVELWQTFFHGVFRIFS